MSIAPPTDIVLDVAQAADPTRRQAAIDTLARAAAGQGGTPADFSAALGSAAAATTRRPTDPSLLASPLSGAGRSQVLAGHGSVYQKLEATLLQNFISTILPKNDELFGDSNSADMARSLLSEKVAEQMSKSGRLGIAQIIERAEQAANAAHSEQAANAAHAEQSANAAHADQAANAARAAAAVPATKLHEG